MKVLKFGGTSVGSADRIHKVINLIDQQSQHSKIAVVVSAIGGITDKLSEASENALSGDPAYMKLYDDIYQIHYRIITNLFNDVEETTFRKITDRVNSELESLKKLLNGIFLINEVSPKTMDKLLSYGEKLSAIIIFYALGLKELNIGLGNSQELIITDDNFTNANVNFELTNINIELYFKTNTADITVIPGFIANSINKEPTTLGRGGSDYTAAIIAAALNAKEIQIWTDVSGMYTANPKLVKQAKPIVQLSYQEAIELSHFGAKVLYPPTVQPVLQNGIPIHIKNTLKPEDPGTIISENTNILSKTPVRGLSNIDHIALLTLQGNGMVGVPGFSKRLFETLAKNNINIIFITQSSSEHSICFGISNNDAQKAKKTIDTAFEYEITIKKLEPIIIETNLSIIALIGDRMKSHQGISGRMFSTLGKNNVNIRAIAQGASERNISAVIKQADVKKALNSLHETFFEVKTKLINLFITGVGNVGERLLNQISQQSAYIETNLKINIRIVGLSNSKTMLIDHNGINLKRWKEQLSMGNKANLNGFLEQAIHLNLRNSVFLDITANNEVAQIYPKYLEQSISVIACNKIACSENLEYYKNLKQLALRYNAAFLFETNVGAGLPVIDTLNHLVNSGDQIKEIQAVLSGSLNYIFNNFNNLNTFHDIVKQAKEEGYTEPDPRIDLGGVDVARKILILARESGCDMELTDIVTENFLTQQAKSASTVKDFFRTLINDESYYQELYSSAMKNNCQLKFVAEFKNGKAKVGLRQIPKGHPFYDLKGKDNIIMFYTERYPEQPMIIKGAGAGAEVTASGLFADIIRVANS